MGSLTQPFRKPQHPPNSTPPNYHITLPFSANYTTRISNFPKSLSYKLGHFRNPNLPPKIKQSKMQIQTSIHLQSHSPLPTGRNLGRLQVNSIPPPSPVRFRPISAVAAPALVKNRRTHSMPPENVEVFKSLEDWASENVLPLLKPVEQCWQPQDFLPDSTAEHGEFEAEVRALRERTAALPDEYFVVLVGDMITEDALPTYQSMINTLDGVKDETGASPDPWAKWTRAWTAEENRHGDLLRSYLYLSGRVDMKMVEKTVQYLIGAGMDPGTENNPYLGFVYTSFQERATFVSHGNTARLAKDGGDATLARICGIIAADEKRHENAYSKIVQKLLEVDPTGAMLAIADMMHKNITMPAHLMYDGQDPKLFHHFSAVAQRLGIYTANDYADILEVLVQRWGLEKMEQGLTADGRRAQDFVCGLAPRIRKLQERADQRAKKLKPYGVKFSWIFNNEIPILS